MKAKTIYVVGVKHSSDKQYAPLHNLWHWTKRDCVARCRVLKAELGSEYKPMKYVYAGDGAS